MEHSAHSVDETVRRLREVLKNRNITLFSVIDHSGEAEKAGLRMPNTKLVVFGNRKLRKICLAQLQQPHLS